MEERLQNAAWFSRFAHFTCASEEVLHTEELGCTMTFTVPRRDIGVVVLLLPLYTTAAVVTFTGRLVMLVL